MAARKHWMRNDTMAKRLRDQGYTVLPPVGWDVAAQANRIMEDTNKEQRYSPTPLRDRLLIDALRHLMVTVAHEHDLSIEAFMKSRPRNTHADPFHVRIIKARADFTGRAKIIGYTLEDIAKVTAMAKSSIYAYWRKYRTKYVPDHVEDALRSALPSKEHTRNYTKRMRLIDAVFVHEVIPVPRIQSKNPAGRVRE